MERLTHRKKDGTVVYLKDNTMIAPVNMSGFDVKQALSRLAELEDRAEPMEPVLVRIMGTDYPQCPKCKRTLWKQEHYCSNCCQAVKVHGKE